MEKRSCGKMNNEAEKVTEKNDPLFEVKMNGDNMRETGFIRRWHFFRKKGGQAKVCLLVLFLVLCHTLRASYAQAVLTMKLENLTVTEALKQVSATTGFEFFYNANQLAKCEKRVNADFKEAKMQEVLADILLETDFTFPHRRAYDYCFAAFGIPVTGGSENGDAERSRVG